jgi:hypothetical protein
VHVIDEVAGETYDSFAYFPKKDRLERSIDAIARGLYFYSYSQRLRGSVEIWPEFLSGVSKKTKVLSSLVAQGIATSDRIGENQSTFHFQQLQRSTDDWVVMRLCFYENCFISVSLKQTV